MAKTKMVWEMEAGDIGRCRDKNHTLCFAQKFPADNAVGVSAVCKKWGFCWTRNFVDGEYERIDKTNFFQDLEDYTVDLLDFKLK